jgi:hypothetical protein
MLGGRPARIGGDLALPNNRIFLQIFAIERSLHFAALAICDVVKFPLHIIWTMNLRCDGSEFRVHFPVGWYVDGALLG